MAHLPGGDNRINGTNDNDTIVGTAGDDLLVGRPGQDGISGIDGDDYLEGNAGDDTLLGGTGDDWLIGGAGDDLYSGGTGTDQFRFYGNNITGAGSATPGSDFDIVEDLNFAEGDQLVFARFGQNIFQGQGSPENLQIIPGEGVPGSGVNVLSWAGLVELVAASPAITAERQPGTDTLLLKIVNNNGSTQIIAIKNGWQPYSDLINEDPTAKADFNGVREDRDLSVSAAKGVLANDSDGDGDSLVVVAVNGSAANVGQTIDGAYGDLTLNADGSYTYSADEIDDGDGDDDDDDCDDGDDDEDGEDGDQDAVEGLVRQDQFTYTASDGQGGESTQTLVITVVEDGQHYRRGSDGSDFLCGRGGRDVLDGGNGNDGLYGGGGADALLGGRGNDILAGGRGADTYVFNADFGQDLIFGFQKGQDRLQFDEDVFGDFAAVSAAAYQSGRNVVIDAGGGNVITLHNYSLSSLQASDFIFI